MTPAIHMVWRQTFEVGAPIGELERRQLIIALRLYLGAPSDTPVVLASGPEEDENVATFRGKAFQIWDMRDGDETRFVAWLSGCEGVFFRAGGNDLVNYTIQSSLELDEDELRPRSWSHDCVGEDCEACSFVSA